MRTSKKGLLLDTATAIVRRDGVSSLTLDGVARESGVSKGGVLYHFPTKEALVLGMVESMVGKFERDIEEYLAVDRGPTGGRWLRAYIEASLHDDACSPDVLAALVAAVSTNEALLEPLRRQAIAWQRAATEDGVDPTRATILRLAVDGLWFADLFGLAPPRGQLRRDLVEALLAETATGRRGR